jgi:hypothetical protein
MSLEAGESPLVGFVTRQCCLSNAEYETQDNILWDDSEQSGKGA